jgi:hypothetical protein
MQLAGRIEHIAVPEMLIYSGDINITHLQPHF